MIEIRKLKSEVTQRKDRSGGLNVLTLVNVNTILELIKEVESKSPYFPSVHKCSVCGSNCKGLV